MPRAFPNRPTAGLRNPCRLVSDVTSQPMVMQTMAMSSLLPLVCSRASRER